MFLYFFLENIASRIRYLALFTSASSRKPRSAQLNFWATICMKSSASHWQQLLWLLWLCLFRTKLKNAAADDEDHNQLLQMVTPLIRKIPFCPLSLFTGEGGPRHLAQGGPHRPLLPKLLGSFPRETRVQNQCILGPLWWMHSLVVMTTTMLLFCQYLSLRLPALLTMLEVLTILSMSKTHCLQ